MERAMRSQNAHERRLLALARRQLGLVHRSQVLTFGFSPSWITRQVAAGRLRHVLPGVYGSPVVPADHRQAALAACLWAGADALASHRTAGALWALDGVVAPASPEISAPRAFSRRHAAVTVHRTADLARHDRVRLGPVVLTSPTRTLIDLAAAIDADALVFATEDAFRRRLTTPARTRARLAHLRRSGRRGTAVLAALLDERGDRRASGSAKEVVLAQLLCRAGLPDPVREHEVRANGRLVARVDLAYPQWKVAIELDSVRWHTGGAALTRDALRRNRLQSLGWIVVSVTVAVLERDPALAVAQVRDAIASRTDPIVARRARLSRR